MSRSYTILLEPNPDEGIYAVTVPSLPGCITQGRTVDECIERAKEAIAVWIAAAVAAGESIPDETEQPRAIVVDVAA